MNADCWYWIKRYEHDWEVAKWDGYTFRIIGPDKGVRYFEVEMMSGEVVRDESRQTTL